MENTSALPIRIVSVCVPGFGRGSKDLGIPTANLDCSRMESSTPFENLPNGIYWGFCRIGENETESKNSHVGRVYKAALSIGYNPTYKNQIKTIEPHLIAEPDDPLRHASISGETLFEDFYGLPVRLSVVGYLRPELPFEGLEKLTVAIKNDIASTEKLALSQDEITQIEKKWVESNESVS
jgi:riboflavin kinase